ncbi:MAG: hypothetical protein GXY81_02390 [Candidatus Cloacimonetes bacterium]|nr:hypothetical protein [Candidatus Cloacimonadota bacterium]
MSKRLMTILLLFSLFLNLGIIGGFIVMRTYRQNHISHHYRPGPPNERGQERPELPEFSDPEVIKLQNDFYAIKKELMQEMAKDPVNETKILSIIERSIQAQSGLEHAMGQKLLEYRKTLTAEEAQEHFSARLDRMKKFEERRNNRRNKQ